MVFKKFCTLHALEFIGENCPECNKTTNNKSETKKMPKFEKESKRTKKIKKKKLHEIETDDIFNNKLKELIEKYNK